MPDLACLLYRSPAAGVIGESSTSIGVLGQSEKAFGVNGKGLNDASGIGGRLTAARGLSEQPPLASSAIPRAAKTLPEVIAKEQESDSSDPPSVA